MSKDKFYFYKEHPKTCDSDDFWGQVKRTVNGEAVSQQQIDMIVEATVSALGLNKKDKLLDVCCGNGALTTLLFDHCQGGIGVDFSEYLISVAIKNFEKLPSRKYILEDALNFCSSPQQADSFTKGVCYGAFSYFEQDRAALFLQSLSMNFPNLTDLFIGNCPDKNLASEFYTKEIFSKGIVDDPTSAIGIWRSEDEFIALANCNGWQASIQKMPTEFYASYYRYDVLLSR